MSFILIGIISIIVCWKWGNWRNWKEYYPTILYFFIGDLIYIVLTRAKPLWNLGEMLGNYPIFQVCFMVCLYPSTTILYLTFYPSASSIRQALYVLLWAGIYVAMEAIALFTGGFAYTNGWSMGYSALFDVLMFPLLRLHYKKPLLVYPISAVLAFLLIFWFGIPLEK